jgi:hypothetical protein
VEEELRLSVSLLKSKKGSHVTGSLSISHENQMLPVVVDAQSAQSIHHVPYPASSVTVLEVVIIVKAMSHKKNDLHIVNGTGNIYAPLLP